MAVNGLLTTLVERRMARKTHTVAEEVISADEIYAAMDEAVKESDQAEAKAKKAAASGYRRQAFEHYKRKIAGVDVNVCVMCGFGIPAILEVAHLDQDRKNNAIENLATLCPNCHKMHDIGLIPSDVVVTMRDLEYSENWQARMKDAGPKAAQTKRANALRLKKSVAAKKAWLTRSGPPARKNSKDD
jgi:hypothetical protein